MNKAIEIKEKIFSIYAVNLEKYLRTIRWLEDSIINQFNKNIYACPLCYKIFSKKDLQVADNNNFLSLEHNPPKSVGGKARVLTCKDCNNIAGNKLDYIISRLLEIESFLFKEGEASIIGKFETENGKISAEFKKHRDSILITMIPKSNPFLYSNFLKDFKKGDKLAGHTKLEELDWDIYSLAMFKSAYLKAFELFGYNFADLGNGIDMRMVLKGEIQYPCPNNGVIDIFADDSMVGINIVREPEELQALIITQKLNFKTLQGTVSKNIPVVLPTPLKGGWSKLANYQKWLNKEMKLKMEKISIPNPPLMDTKEYHELFVP